jgi:hypothetical protein
MSTNPHIEHTCLPIVFVRPLASLQLLLPLLLPQQPQPQLVSF